MTTADVNALASQIASAAAGSLSTNLQAGCWIRTIERLPDGQEALRRIVRDNILGQAKAVTDALGIGL